MPRMKNLFHLGPRASTIRPQHSGACHNCHAPVAEKFCGQCGQPSHVHVASAHEFIHHFIGHFVAAEGKLWRTLGALLFRPGQLTREFIAGRRGRYIDPLRLLLTISLLAFLVMKLVLPVAPMPDAGAVGAPAHSARAPAEKPPVLLPLQKVLVDTYARYSVTFAGNYAEYLRLSSEQRTWGFFRFWITTGPTIALCLVPLLAAWLKLAQAGTGWRYGEHLVFSFNLLSFALLATALSVALSTLPNFIWMGVLAIVPVYLLLAMRKVYGGNWALVLLRGALVGSLSLQSFKLCMWIVFYGKLVTARAT
jgi:hypothetical protein